MGYAAHEIRIGNKPQHAGPDEEPHEDLANHRGLIYTGSDEVAGQGDKQQ